MSNLSSLESWFKERPLWLQDAACRIILSGKLRDLDYQELAILCLREAGLKVNGFDSLFAHGIIQGTLDRPEGEPKVVELTQISDLKGINQLNPRKPLILGEAPLTIIYGPNGSGKSGYVRALKHAVGAKEPGRLHMNVYTEDNSEQSCTLTSLCGDDVKDFTWNPKLGVINELRDVQIYDRDCGYIYVTEENEMAYEPWILGLFSQLTNACAKIKGKVEEQKLRLTKPSLEFPSGLKQTDEYNWFSSISHTTTKKKY